MGLQSLIDQRVSRYRMRAYAPVQPILTGGATPKRVVISEWKSMDDAKKFYSSPAVKKASEDRKKFTSGQRTFIVEALAN